MIGKLVKAETDSKMTVATNGSDENALLNVKWKGFPL